MDRIERGPDRGYIYLRAIYIRILETISGAGVFIYGDMKRVCRMAGCI
jgi:hypothetical protein